MYFLERELKYLQSLMIKIDYGWKLCPEQAFPLTVTGRFIFCDNYSQLAAIVSGNAQILVLPQSGILFSGQFQTTIKH